MELIIKGIPGSLRSVYERLCIRIGRDIWPADYDPGRKTIIDTIDSAMNLAEREGVELQQEQVKGIRGELLFVRGLDSVISDNRDIDKGEARLLHSVQLPDSRRKNNRKRLEPDHIYIDQRGIWSVEAKYWSIPGAEYPSKKPEGYIHDALEQAEENAHTVSGFLGLKKEEVMPVVFDWNGCMEGYKIPKDISVVCTATRFYEGLVQKSKEHYLPEEVRQISSALEKEIRPVMSNRVIASLASLL